MNATSGKRLLVVWLVLSVITVVSPSMTLLDPRAVLTPNPILASGVLLIACVKTRIIFREFMDVRHAPILLGRITDAWLLLTVVCLLAAYFVGMAHRPGPAG